MRFVSVAFILTGAAALVSFAAPAASNKKAAPKKAAPAAKSKSASTGKATVTKAKSTKSTAKRTSSRTVGRRSRRRGSYRPYLGQQRPSPERIQEIERALASRGFLAAEPDGNWDQASADALKRFQQSENLPADGKLSALSLIALGMGAPQNGVVVPAVDGPPSTSEPVAPAPNPGAAIVQPSAPVTTAAAAPPPPFPPPVQAPPPVSAKPEPPPAAPPPKPKIPGKHPPLVLPDTSVPPLN